MDKNVDHGSAIECTGAHIRLTKSPKEEEKSFYAFSVSVLLLASVERFGVSRMRDFFLFIFGCYHYKKCSSVQRSAVQPNAVCCSALRFSIV